MSILALGNLLWAGVIFSQSHPTRSLGGQQQQQGQGQQQGQQGQGQQQQQGHTDNVTVREGESAVLRCYLEGQVGRMAWLNRSSILFAGSDKWSSDPRVSLAASSRSEYNMRIAQVAASDEGPYTCSVQTHSHPRTSQVHVIVQVPPKVTNVSSDVTVNEGANVTIFCGGSGRPEPVITWRHLSPAAKDDEYEGEYLEIEGISRDQAGEYQCSATNDVASPDTRRVRVTVNFAPTYVDVRNLGMMLGHQGSLRCETAALPAPNFEWFRNDKRLVSGVRGLLITVSGRRSVLTFPNVTEELYGNYTCLVFNSLGGANSSLLLNRATALANPAQIQGTGTVRDGAGGGATASGAPSLPLLLLLLLGLSSNVFVFRM
ncbi:limbic system-associated membrane protein-like isoform X2 [Petromyzon marinus]|uniref:limbic system-associated membrane protein-like isoform X2 n=1 Tax=Petromyzon marinus TaxID=7757 RepID=UPI003F713B6B